MQREVPLTAKTQLENHTQSAEKLRINKNLEEYEQSEHRYLCSSTTHAAVVVQTRTQFGKCAFSICDPKL